MQFVSCGVLLPTARLLLLPTEVLDTFKFVLPTVPLCGMRKGTNKNKEQSERDEARRGQDGMNEQHDKYTMKRSSDQSSDLRRRLRGWAQSEHSEQGDASDCDGDGGA